MSDITTNVPYVSPKLDVRKVASAKDEGLRDTAAHWLFATPSECEYTEREFGVIAKAQNAIFEPRGDVTIGFVRKKLTIPYDEIKSKDLVLSEIFLALNPGASTTMMSHEGEIYECVGVVDGTMEHVEDVNGHNGLSSETYRTGDIFFSVNSSPSVVSHGFYHQLRNLNVVGLALSKITTLAEKNLAMKDGKFMKYGFNRPPNSYKPKV
jgi:hypothetical protein